MVSDSSGDTFTQDYGSEAALYPGDGQIQDYDEPPKLSFAKWIEERFNWSWFTCTQSTGGIAIILSECPKQFDGLQTIGVVVYIFNLVLFLGFTSLMVMRWTLNPAKIRECFTNPPECFFYGSFWLSFATIIISMEKFGVSHTGPWIIVAVRVLYWLYAAITLLSSTIQFIVVFKYTPVKSISMNPAWFLMIFQAMLTGTVAASIAGDQPAEQRLPIIVSGVAYQGLGWLVSLLFLAWFIGNLMENGWPEPNQRAGMFMPSGAASYSIVVLIGSARSAPTDYGYFALHPTASEVLQIVALWVGIFLWLFAFWLFSMALLVCLAEVVVRKEGKWQMPMSFKNSWWGEYMVHMKCILVLMIW